MYWVFILQYNNKFVEGDFVRDFFPKFQKIAKNVR